MPWAATFLRCTLSLRHGVFTAALGLLGGFLMPMLLHTGEPVGGGFFAYLVLLQAALLAVARHRQWVGLSAAALVCAGAWAIASMVGALPVTHPFWVQFLLIGSAVAFVMQAIETGDRTTAAAQVRLTLAIVASFAAAALLAIHVAIAGFAPHGMWTMIAVSAATVVLARLDPRHIGLPWITMLCALALLTGWAGHQHQLFLPQDLPPEFQRRFITALIAMGGIFWLGGYACQWRQHRAWVWALLSATAALTFTTLAVVELWTIASEHFPWWLVTATIALVEAGMVAGRHLPTRPADAAADQTDRPTLILALCAAALATIAIGLGLHDRPPWLSVGWAALLPALVHLRFAMRIPALGAAIIAALGLVTITLLGAPGPTFTVTGYRYVFNTLLLAYGGPVLLAGIAAWRLRLGRDPMLGSALEIITFLYTVLGAVWITRHAFIPGEPFAPVGMYESATHPLHLTLLGLLAYAIGRWLTSTALRRTGAAAAVFGLILGAIASILAWNPLWTDTPVGPTILFNGLLLLYAAPLLLAATCAALFRRGPDPQIQHLTAVCGVLALLLLFAWVSLSVRQGFAGTILTLRSHDIGKAEWYAYSMAWILLGLALLAAGVASGSRTIRTGSLAVMLLAIGKVFLFDAAELRDLYRVLSFLGLGLSLIGLGYVYQRWVFRRPPSA